MRTLLGLMSLLIGVVAGSASATEDQVIHLEHVSTIYVPYSYLTTPKVNIDSDSVEQFAYDAAEGYVYVVGDDYLQIIDYNDIKKPEVVFKRALPHRANDIAHCGRFVAYVIQGSDSQESGTLYVYEKYDRQTKSFNKLFETIISSQPEMLIFTPDCRRILTANEGTAGDDATETSFVNPEGMVTIIKIIGDQPTFEVTMATFDSFNSRRQKYLNLGVRFPYNGHYTNYTEQTLAESMEPEYIAINPTANVAYVNLQENNAIAILDLNTDFITEIVPLGVKDWRNLELDPSDRDDAVAFQTGHDIKSFYMPDAIKYFEIDGVGYIATADEGSDLDYRFNRQYWGDAKRGESIHDENMLASTVSTALREALNDDLKLGRLEFSVTDGESTSEPGKLEELYFFGGRGFSILRASDLSRVFDSGDDIEHQVAKYFPNVFNSETYDDLDSESPPDLADKRSDNRGPECESIEIGEVDGKIVLFVGVDRASVIAIYTLDSDGQATFQSLNRNGWTNMTFAQLLQKRRLGDLDPKDIEFVSANDSPTNKPLLMVAGTASGTISLYEVKMNSSDSGPADFRGAATSHISTSGLVAIAFLSAISLLLRN